MKKITHLISSIILLVLINGCAGYEPIFSSTNLEFEIDNHSIEGDKILGNKIYSQLRNLTRSNKNKQNIKKVNLFINVSKNKDATSKNSSGKVLEYKITLTAEIKVTDFIDDNKILEQTFVSSLSYKVQDQHYETVKLENKSIENLLNKIYQELLVKLSQNITTK